ncbi:MAG: hypothetical protein K2X55_13475 [Burkholderiaceae bacterium]|nr:hypothetical protein [Burkholderiaceae bacterium]
MQLDSPYQLAKNADIDPGTIVLAMVDGVTTTGLVITYDEDGYDKALLHLDGDKKGCIQQFQQQQYLVLRLPVEVRLPIGAKAWSLNIPDGARFLYAVVKGEGYFVLSDNSGSDRYFSVNTHTGLWSGLPKGGAYVNSWALWTVEDEPRLLIES